MQSCCTPAPAPSPPYSQYSPYPYPYPYPQHYGAVPTPIGGATLPAAFHHTLAELRHAAAATAVSYLRTRALSEPCVPCEVAAPAPAFYPPAAPICIQAPAAQPPAPQTYAHVTVSVPASGSNDDCARLTRALQEEIEGLKRQIEESRTRQAQMTEHMATLRIAPKQQMRSKTNVSETYKVKTLEMAAKLAVMDGTDDGMYNGLPIEVEGMGLYRDLRARGIRPRDNVSLSGRPLSQASAVETYKVQTLEMAQKLAKISGSTDGTYNGLPIEIVGVGLYSDHLRYGPASKR
eukprot:EG_transcript_16537